MDSKILVLCTGNICRSPIAEGILQSRLGQPFKVWSAGTAAPLGVQTHPFAVRAAALLGYDLPTEKRSSQVLLGDLTVAKLILVMELHHKQYVRRRSISFDQKTFMLGHWLGKEIPDPMGRDLAAFEAAAHLIDQAIDTWLPRIDLLPTETAKVTGE